MTQHLLADMDNDGVYFPEEIKKVLEDRKKELTCEYSGLPSLLSYLDETEYHIGHS